MLSDNHKFWNSRKEAMDGLIYETTEMVDVDALCTEIEKWQATDLSGQDAGMLELIRKGLEHETAVLMTSRQALDSLKRFSNAALQFFLDGFYDRPNNLEISAEFSPPMVLKTLTTEISNDLVIFQRSLHQRQLLHKHQTYGESQKDDPNGGMTGHLFLLSVSDRLASAALQPAFDAGYLHKGIAATHMGDDFSIRLIPYFDMLLIEVPFTTGSILTEGNIIPVPGTEHLGILHEVGHHVYRYGKVPGTRHTFEEFLTEQLYRQGITGGLANWLEEIFADMYGLLVGGPVMVLSYQELLSQSRHSYLMEDTGEHPIPILRPFILTRAMKLIRAGTKSANLVYKNAPAILDKNWDRFLNDPDVLTRLYRPQGVFHPISGAMIIEGLVPILEQILDVLIDLRPIGARPAWTKDLAKGEDVAALRDQLQQALFLKKVQPPENPGDQTLPNIRQYEKLLGKPLSVDQWFPLFSIPGWSTELQVGQVSTQGVGDMPRKG